MFIESEILLFSYLINLGKCTPNEVLLLFLLLYDTVKQLALIPLCILHTKTTVALNNNNYYHRVRELHFLVVV